MGLPGIASQRFANAIREATADLTTVLGVTEQVGSPAVEPSHILVALARIRGGFVAGLFEAANFSQESLVVAMRRTTSASEPVLELTDAALTDATREVVAELADEEVISERLLACAVLDHLEPRVRTLLERYGGVDVEAWRAAANIGPPTPVAILDDGGRAALAVLGPAARWVLSRLTAPQDGSRREVSTLDVLALMAARPGGVLTHAAIHLAFDPVELRARLAALRATTPDLAAPPATADVELSGALRSALVRAATHAAEASSPAVGEGDLLHGLLEPTDGAVAQVMRSSGVNLVALRTFVEQYHVESEEDEQPADPPVDASVAAGVLEAKLIGQTAVAQRLVPAVETIIRAARRGFRLGDRPLGSFLFCGPSGTGKTMTARLIAEAVFGSTDDLLIFDMGQFKTPESINNFIGAPPGYVGYGEGRLTNGLAAKPRCVLLFDEAEKADNQVNHALLALFDEGRVTDPAGPVLDARDTVVVLTSNVGQGLAGYPGDVDAALRAELLANKFPPEFLNRIDHTLLFAPFGRSELEAIAVAGLRGRATDIEHGLGVVLRWDADVPAHLARTALRRRPAEAARGVNRTVDEIVALVLNHLDQSGTEIDGLRGLRVRLSPDGLEVTDDDE